ncbi:MAG: tyrosine-type recombinase/integrase [Gammaproteobacteria bacterium]
MPRPRKKEHAGLPKRWCLRHGAYYYQVPSALRGLWDNKTWFRLGKTLPEAYRTWANRIELHANARTIGDLLDRYACEVVPTKAAATQRSNELALPRLKSTFGHMMIADLRPVHVYGYLDRRGKIARTSANREIEVLSHTYTKAIEWGLTDNHPIKGKVRKLSTPPRTRYIEDWELIEAITVAPPTVAAYIGVKLLTGLRQSDLLRLRVQDIRDDGIHVATRKTRRPLIIEMTPALDVAINRAKAARPKDIAPWLFCTRKGQCFVSEEGRVSAWKSLWQRFMARVLKKTKVTERFTEHDLRAKCASDAATLEHAQQLLAHANSSTTRRIYRRAPERVRPLR